MKSKMYTSQNITTPEYPCLMYNGSYVVIAKNAEYCVIVAAPEDFKHLIGERHSGYPFGFQVFDGEVTLSN